jgi:hypothetical protein
VYCLFPVYQSLLENELPENFQDVDFEDIELLQVGFEGKCP